MINIATSLALIVFILFSICKKIRIIVQRKVLHIYKSYYIYSVLMQFPSDSNILRCFALNILHCLLQVVRSLQVIKIQYKPLDLTDLTTNTSLTTSTTS